MALTNVECSKYLLHLCCDIKLANSNTLRLLSVIFFLLYVCIIKKIIKEACDLPHFLEALATFEFSKYLLHFRCVSKLLNSVAMGVGGLLRCLSCSKHCPSSIGTPKFARNWIEESASFKLGKWRRCKTSEIFHTFLPVAQIFYTRDVHTRFISVQNLSKSTPSSSLHTQGVPGGMDKTSGECSLC